MRYILFRLLDPMVAGRDIQNVLDVGWGTGYLARLLQARYEWRVFPVAAAWEGQLGIERMTEAGVRTLPFPDRAFDAAFLLDVLGHVPREEIGGVLDEAVRLLARKGLLVLRVPALEVFRTGHEHRTSERQRFTRDRLVGMVEQRGMRVLRSSYINAAFAPIGLLKFRVLEPMLGRPVPVGPATVPVWIDRLCSVPLTLESFWLGLGLNLPVGQTLLVIAERES
jgi:SAM-dependent methyltransferase